MMDYPWLTPGNEEFTSAISYLSLNFVSEVHKGEDMKHSKTSDINLKDDTDRRIVEAVARGMCDKEIASVIFLSTQTVRNRISRILTSSGLRNRTQLAVTYLASGVRTKEDGD